MILPYGGKTPRLGPLVFVAPTASIVGDVELGARSSVWFGATLRGDDHFIRIGDETNIQDNVVVHEGRGQLPAIVGNRVTVGHSACLHGCKVGDLSLIGMGAILLDGCEIGEGCVVAAGSLVVAGTKVPSGMLIMGSPARVKRQLSPEESAHLAVSAANYVHLGSRYLNELWHISG